jgi:hypothetical protein
VFRPGEPAPEGNVYADWATLVADLPTVEGYKSIQIDDSLVTPAVIPAGSWDMTEVEIAAFVSFKTVPPGQLVNLNIADGASLPNLKKIGGPLIVTNLNTVTAPVVAPSTGYFFEVSRGNLGSEGPPTIINSGAAPFIDATALAGASFLILRLSGTLGGTGGPFINLTGAPAGLRLLLGMLDQASITANRIAGDAGQTLSVIEFTRSSLLGRQATFLGTIARSLYNTGVSRSNVFPPAPAAPAGAPIATIGTGLGFNTTLRFDTTVGDVAQVLPLIRAAAPAAGATVTTAGVLDSTGLDVTIKNEVGANNVNVTPNAINPDTIEGGAGPVVIPPGGSRTFRSNGLSNWLIVASYL